LFRSGKRGKDRITLINNECAATLRRYLELKPSFFLDDREPLFFTEYGKRWQRTEVHRLFTRYKAKAGIEKDGGVQKFQACRFWRNNSGLVLLNLVDKYTHQIVAKCVLTL
ncbi:MAG: hypothetical protein PHQ39_12910, partial [Methanothrix soehngenii]|nr:hypothetical protein [Methanothrix soehngenii]